MHIDSFKEEWVQNCPLISKYFPDFIQFSSQLQTKPTSGNMSLHGLSLLKPTQSAICEWTWLAL